MATGHGQSLGGALVDLTLSLGGRKASYTEKGWHAQLSRLTETARGRAAADAVGLSPSHQTLIRWLSEQQSPNAENRQKIAEAFERAARSFPEALRSGQQSVRGVIDSGDRRRERTLVVDAGEGTWDRIEEAWEDGTLTDVLFEELYIHDVIEEDIGRPSGGWSFPGSSYAVSA